MPMTVEVRDAAGGPVKAGIIVFRLSSGAMSGASVDDSIAVTDVAGRATGMLRLGTQEGAVTVRAYPLGADNRGVTFTATATAGPTLTGVLPYTVGPGDTLSIAGSALGGVDADVQIGTTWVRPVTGTAALLRVVVPNCLADGMLDVRVRSGTAWTSTARIAYTSRRRTLALRPYDAMVIDASTVASCVMLAGESGAEYMLVPHLASSASSPVSTMARISAGGVSGRALYGIFSERAPLPEVTEASAQTALDKALRDQEAQLAPLARDVVLSQVATSPLTVGSRRTFSVQTSLDGSTFAKATGALRWLGDHVAIYVDTVTAAQYTDGELAQLGRLFDRELYSTVTTTFGPEPDIDKNGHVIVFMTPHVNALVPGTQCVPRRYVTGFFSGRDLIASAANSNAGELFYALVPDIAGRFSCPNTKAEVMRLVTGTFIHEMQHMISYFHHVVARHGEPEDLWLNEGLSHIAEETASRLFEARFPPPSGRSVEGQLFPDSAQAYITPQLQNAYVYLNSTANNSVTTFEETGSMEERGAAWLFLRWLADHKGETIFSRLVQTPRHGIANVEAVANESFGALFGDFSIALWADSLVGVSRERVPARYRFLSRNLRQLMARQAFITGWDEPFPVKTVRVPLGGFAEGPLVPGTMVFGTLGPFTTGQSPVALTFSKKDGAPFAAGDGAQLGIFRVK